MALKSQVSEAQTGREGACWPLHVHGFSQDPLLVMPEKSSLTLTHRVRCNFLRCAQRTSRQRELWVCKARSCA
eukprot:1677951-Amphidinium_carterae.1